jgi:galactitol-specific phosphotransferase system IIB component
LLEKVENAMRESDYTQEANCCKMQEVLARAKVYDVHELMDSMEDGFDQTSYKTPGSFPEFANGMYHSTIILI